MNSTTLFLSTAVKMVSATPFFTQFSDSVRAGCPYFPAVSSAMVVGVGEEPATMSTARCVRTSICWATSLIRSSDTLFGPVTPATRTRTTLIGSFTGGGRCRNSPCSAEYGSAASVVIRFTGWLT